MLRHIWNLTLTVAATLPLAIAAVCLMCIVLAMMVLHSSHEQMQI